MKYCLWLFLVVSSIWTQAQTSQTSTNEVVKGLQESKVNQGKIVIFQDYGIDYLLDTQLNANKQSSGFEGFRVQIYKGSGPAGKKGALEAKSTFLSVYPNMSVYLEYSPPFWRVKAGDFRNKYEAVALQERIKNLFPSCYVVKDPSVNMSKLK